ncbi:MAG TPA: hypothetical protein VLA55_03940, partial [Ornithinibacter sp.]|nr:hypothetical protein [Ornithinibacter sp.]
MSAAPAVIAVVGASGGLGASTLALAVGRRLAATGPESVVIDLDLRRGGLEVTAGTEHLPGRRWDDLREVRGRLPPGALPTGLPYEDGVHLLSVRGGAGGEVSDAAVLAVLSALAAGSTRLVFDLPLWSPALPAILALEPLVVVLAGLRTRALADADAAVAFLLDQVQALAHPAAVDLRLVTRGVRTRAEVLDDVVAHLGIAHLHHLGDDPLVPR